MAYDGSLVFDTSLETDGFMQSISNLSTAASSLLGFDELFSKLYSLSSIVGTATQNFAALQNQSFLTQSALLSAFNSQTLLQTVQNSLNGVLGLFSGLSNSEQIFFAGQNIINNVASGVSTNAALFQAITSSIASAKSTALSSISAFSFSSVGMQMVNGIASGIFAGASGVVSAITSVVNSAISAAKSILDIHSPSRVFDLQIGRMMMSGLENGINSGAKSAKAAMQAGMAGITSSALRFAKAQLKNSSSNIFSDIFGGETLFKNANFESSLATLALKKNAEIILAQMKRGIASSALQFSNYPAAIQGATTAQQTQSGAVTNLYMTVNTHDSLSESELTRQAENFLTRARRKLP